ncbi:MAG TPA: class I SAM-dependent methyltransferase [Longimicrobium sp.]|jgi:SAM-dependent methyltransferase|nr:class I SAM-dependent methyltransferase [Longimicrobium sp.]
MDIAASPHAGFTPVRACWVCAGGELRPVHAAIFELSEYARQDPELARYTGATVEIVRCAACGFGQPAALPALEGFFGRMYDQRWSAEWMETEYTSGYKDLIFRSVLGALEARVPSHRRTLLDLGAHVGRLMAMAAERGWTAEGVELNPSTAAYAARATGLAVHRMDARALADRGLRYGAVTLIDVLEHIPEPVAALEAARTVLAPGGWIAVKVPHGRVQLGKEELHARLRPRYRATVADNLVHVNHFGPRSLRLALERAGFTGVRVEVAAPELVPRATARVRAGNAARLAVWRLGRLLPRGVESPLSLHLQAYAHNAAG